METLKDLLPTILSWPTVTIVCILSLRGSITAVVNRLINSSEGTAKLGPIEVQLGKIAAQSEDAVDRVNDLTIVMAESRITELQITLDTFGQGFSAAARAEIEGQIKRLSCLVLKSSEDF